MMILMIKQPISTTTLKANIFLTKIPKTGHSGVLSLSSCDSEIERKEGLTGPSEI